VAQSRFLGKWGAACFALGARRVRSRSLGVNLQQLEIGLHAILRGRGSYFETELVSCEWAGLGAPVNVPHYK
jgi:hypothetical protein